MRVVFWISAIISSFSLFHQALNLQSLLLSTTARVSYTCHTLNFLAQLLFDRPRVKLLLLILFCNWYISFLLKSISLTLCTFSKVSPHQRFITTFGYDTVLNLPSFGLSSLVHMLSSEKHIFFFVYCYS